MCPAGSGLPPVLPSLLSHPALCPGSRAETDRITVVPCPVASDWVGQWETQARDGGGQERGLGVLTPWLPPEGQASAQASLSMSPYGLSFEQTLTEPPSPSPLCPSGVRALPHVPQTCPP